jgi:murein DD-endopeptidase MepM/ murein hydrolase activator NlpD
MEDTIRKTMPRRSTVSQRRRNKPVYNYKIIRKVLVQLIASGLILIFILGIKNINISATKQIDTGISSIIHTSLDFNNIYKGISAFATNVYNQGKDLFQKQLKSQPAPDKSPVQENETILPPVKPANSTTIEKNNSAAPVKHVSELKQADPILSSINSSDIDIKSIKSQYVFATPLKGRISSPFGLRIHPITKKDEFHPGLDIVANKGTVICASLGGTVIEARKGQTFGNFIKIQSGKDITTVYAHCNKLLVKKGQKINRGQKIAEVGDTGLALGAHLHFEIWKAERPVDPIFIVSSYGKL